MTDRPIIFAGPMVAALLEQRKTQTRRLATSPLRHCQPGDRLWVKENLAYSWEKCRWYYRWDGVELESIAGKTLETPTPDRWPLGVCNSIHMPRWASRLTLTVEGVRTEPLQSISEADALAEGIDRLQFPDRGDWGWPQRRYLDLWQSLHDKLGQRWEDNPEVLVLTFRVERGNIDRSGVSQ